MTHHLEVRVPVPVDHTFTYTYTQPLAPGTVVHVPFGRRTLWAVVWAEAPTNPAVSNPKAILGVHPVLRFSPAFCQFLADMAAYTLSSLGAVLKMALPTISYNYGPLSLYGLGGPLPKPWTSRLHPYEGELKTLEAWQQEAGISERLAKQWVAKGILEARACCLPPPVESLHPLQLTPEQQDVAEQIKVLLAPQVYMTVLLEGVTGSGKTEVCLWLCEQVWHQGKQVLILVPEIVLSQQWEKRLEKYFALEIGRWNSTLSPAQRQKMFEKITQGHCPVVVGARSALFLPFRNLGLIIVDEEHDPSYKQEESICYHGRDMAVMRAYQEKIPIVLVSATPSLETCWNIEQGKYRALRLTQRYGHSLLPSFHIIDLRQFARGSWISPPLRQALEQTLQQGAQSLLFLNRRGYAALLLCKQCGYRAACPNCSVWLTVHESNGAHILLCHYCNFSIEVPSLCPQCQQEAPLLMYGPGVEQIKKEVESFLPQARISLFSSDTLTNPTRVSHTLHQIRHREVDIIVGTQMIAKGHHFPFLTCVGIVDADFGLTDLDIRACERLYQIICQVTGRAGRESLRGHTYLQTLQPSHFLLQHFIQGTLEGFVAEEMKARQGAQIPPFARLAAIILSGLDEVQVQTTALGMKKVAPYGGPAQILGPSPAPLNPLRRRYRWRFLLKAPRSVSLQPLIQAWLKRCRIPRAVQVDIDIDPYSFL